MSRFSLPNSGLVATLGPALNSAEECENAVPYTDVSAVKIFSVLASLFYTVLKYTSRIKFLL